MAKHTFVSFSCEPKTDSILVSPEKRIELEFCADDIAKDSFVQRDTFKREFQLIWENREAICNTPELSNIITPFVGVCYAYTGCRVTLGMMLNLYHQGKLRVGQCAQCGSELLGYYFCGSLLSGMGSHYGFCPNCGKEERYNGHGYVHKNFFGYAHPFPVEPTPWTITTLVLALKSIEE